ncbi:MAG: hypothetical protein IT440_12300 [Phycisphaeraceae bacterium]|nr:hypothetical protein [Phycisphaeraceae bacterium]
MRHPRSAVTVALLLGFMLGTWNAPCALAAPEPAIVAKTYQFDFTYSKPQAIAVREIDGTLNWYWFLPYKVTNNTGEDRQFIPDFTLATESGQIFSTGRNVPASAFDLVKEQLSNPLLQSPIDVVGKLLQGPDFAKESVAIWPQFTTRVERIRIFVSGLSGETSRVFFGRSLKIVNTKTKKTLFDGPYSMETELRDVPGEARVKVARVDLSFDGLNHIATQPNATDPAVVKDAGDAWVATLTDGDHQITLTQLKAGQEFVLRKTLMIGYEFPGVMDRPQQQAVIPLGAEWVMR